MLTIPVVGGRAVEGAVRGVGIDVVDVAAVGDSLERYGARYRSRICGPAETAELDRHRTPQSAQVLAFLFGLKESVTKVLAPERDASWPWTAIQSVGGRSPSAVRVDGAAAERAHELELETFMVAASTWGGLVTVRVVGFGPVPQ
ncbi:4'-phosphopantetheinyl transferase superfamily protein [Agilicoccus flavus]|uniref:4'-phosphopantetheinyl transferase superfamily protein n=1 Tax=Agilicoccus flavus TaxID=2775968 RepID=UPI001CF640CC|nr:4'-phosphopantetheinyl transferase superfamily protein [Agilicoccus flavus]